MFKNKNFLLTVILPIFVSIIIGIVIVVLNSNALLKTQATAVVSGEKSKFTLEMSKLKSEKKELSQTAAKYDKMLEENQLLLEEINSMTAELNDYTAAIEKAKETITSLDTSISEKTSYNESLSSLSADTDGSSKSYKDTKLNIPTDLKAGRYRADGEGKLMIYTIAGTLRDKQDLSLLDTHSYTFDISSGESVKIEGSLSLTEINE